MLHRRSTATALVALLLPAAAALSSCGFDYATDQVNTIGAGVHDRGASVDVLGVRVLAFSDGNGRLIGTLVNDDKAEEAAELTSVEGTDVQVEVSDVRVSPRQAVNLAADDATPIAVTGTFTAGGVVPLTFTFSTGESVSLDVPVVKACGQYESIASPTLTDDPAGDTETGTSASEGTSDATYLCEHETEDAEEGGH